FLVEYRPKERWDAAFAHSAVFVHWFADNHSYVMRGTAGNFDLAAGNSFERGNTQGLLSVLTGFTKMDVIAIDDNARTATIRLVRRPAFVAPSLVGQVLVGIAGDGPGIFIVGGKIHFVPPRGLANTILQNLGAYLDTAAVSNANLNAQLQREVLGAMTRTIED